MLKLSHSPEPNRLGKTGNAWGELASICRKVHAALYQKRDKTSARRYRPRLEQILSKLPKSDLAILREEGHALLHELNGETRQAIAHRRKEIRLMTRLHHSVSSSIANGDYDATTGRSILAGRDLDALAERRAIVRALLDSDEQRKTSSMRPRAAGRKAKGLVAGATRHTKQ